MPRQLSKNLPFEEHQEHGEELMRIHNLLVKLVVRVGNVYGVTDKATKVAEKACASIDELRSQLDSKVFTEYGDREKHELTHVYYGA